MPAPVFGDSYLVISSPTPVQPNQNEQMPNLDPAFMTAWNATKSLFPNTVEGDNDTINAAAILAYRYKSGTGVYTPAIGTISPTTGVHAVGFTLTVNGTNFDANAIINFNGVDLATTNVSNLQLTAQVPAALIPAAGTYPVVVRNPGAASASATFTAT
jgi:IPT/TIG domain-containing protein